MTQETLIKTNFNLPNHEMELYKATEIIIKLRTKLNNVIYSKKISPTEHTLMFEEIVQVLDYIGNLSQTVFDIEEELEKQYTLHYHQAPKLGKKLYWNHYESLHHPYSLLKNRCHRMLEELDQHYIKTNNSKPPNWNI